MKKTRVIAVAAALVVALAAAVFAAYDSSEDPFVTLSYLNKQFTQKVQTLIDEAIAPIKAKVDAYSAPAQTAADADSTAYEVLELKKGARLMAHGSCEVILRQGGTAAVVSPFAEQGIGDLSDGSELLDGAALPINHLLLIPRGGDGRGIVITSDKAYVMVRGKYAIENAG
jgi:hypothetical protein